MSGSLVFSFWYRYKKVIKTQAKQEKQVKSLRKKEATKVVKRASKPKKRHPQKETTPTHK
jgi:hypothetical protein